MGVGGQPVDEKSSKPAATTSGVPALPSGSIGIRAIKARSVPRACTGGRTPPLPEPSTISSTVSLLLESRTGAQRRVPVACS